MSSQIFINNSQVLRTSPGVIESLYYELDDVIKKRNLNNDSNLEITNFMSIMEFYSENMCSYLHIDEFIKSSSSALILLSILGPAIERLTLSVASYTTKDLWEFYKELLIYQEDLSAKGL